MKLLKKNWRICFGGGLFLLLILLAVFAPLLSPHDPLAQSLQLAMQAPSLAPAANGSHYFLGTDQLGRDELSRLIYGGRVSLTVGLVSVVISGIAGVALGLLAGYCGGTVDAVIMRLADIQLAVPSILLAIVLVAVLGPSLTNIILVLSITGWVQYARIIRGNVLTIKEMEYVEAAKCIGSGFMRIIFREILPNIYQYIIVVATLQMARMILLEASLSFLGLSANIAIPTWGNMISDGKNYITTSWWLCVLPGLAIVLVIISVNMLGDWLRDVLDPQLT